MTEFDLGHFRSHGYQVLPDIIEPATIQSVGGFLKSQMSGALEELRDDFAFADPGHLMEEIALAEQAGRLTGLPEDTKRTISGHFSLQVRLSRTLWGVPRSPKLQRLMSLVFPGQTLRMHMPPTARFVLPGNQYAAVPAHQDIAYNRHLQDFVTVWVPFVPIDDLCGGVAFYTEGNVERELANAGKGTFWLGPVSGVSTRKVHVEVPLGGALLFNKWIVHESMPNRSDRTRISIDYRFFGSSHRSTKHYLDVNQLTVVEPTGRSSAAQSDAPARSASL